MDHPTRRRRWLPPPILLGVVLLVALAAILALASSEARTSVQEAIRALASGLRRTVWAWPLAAALLLVALTSPPARRRWPRRASRIQLAIAGWVVLVLATATGPGAVLLVAAVLVTVGLLAAWVVVVPRRLVPPAPAEVLDSLSDRDRLEMTDARVKLQHDIRTTALQAVAGLAVLAGAVLGFQQLTEDRRQATATQELTRQGQASERFTRAIDQLGSDRIEVRLGGIYGLEQIAQQAPDNRLPVTEVLVAYLRRRIPRPAKPSSDPRPRGALRDRAPDVQAALTVLGRRQTAPGDPPLDFHELDLVGADLVGANLVGAKLFRADLNSVDFTGADLRGANLFNADLTGAQLIGADLRGANLDAELGIADLHGATANRHTTWPDGFDWQDAGVRLETGSGKP